MIPGKTKRKADRRKSARMKVPYQRFERRRAEVQIRRGGDPEEVVAGRAFMHDLSPTGIALFVAELFAKGEAIQIVIEGRRPLYLKGTVVACGDSYTTAKVIRAESFPYRIGVKLNFDDPEERKLVEKYCAELAIAPEK